MALKPVKDLAIHTSRDEQRRLERLALQEHWGKVEAHIDEVLDATLPHIKP